MRARPLLHAAVFVAVVAAGLAADLATKHWAFARLGMPGRDRIWIWRDVLSLETNLNEGALFGVGAGWSPLFVTLSLLAACGIVGWFAWQRASHGAWMTLAMASVLAGILGNLYDRLGLPGLVWDDPERLGAPVYAVRDWIHFRVERGQFVFDWPVFNLADTLLFCGVSVLVVLNWRSQPQPTATSAAVAGAKEPLRSR